MQWEPYATVFTDSVEFAVSVNQNQQLLTILSAEGHMTSVIAGVGGKL